MDGKELSRLKVIPYIVNDFLEGYNLGFSLIVSAATVSILYWVSDKDNGCAPARRNKQTETKGRNPV